MKMSGHIFIFDNSNKNNLKKYCSFLFINAFLNKKQQSSIYKTKNDIVFKRRVGITKKAAATFKLMRHHMISYEAVYLYWK